MILGNVFFCTRNSCANVTNSFGILGISVGLESLKTLDTALDSIRFLRVLVCLGVKVCLRFCDLLVERLVGLFTQSLVVLKLLVAVRQLFVESVQDRTFGHINRFSHRRNIGGCCIFCTNHRSKSNIFTVDIVVAVDGMLCVLFGQGIADILVLGIEALRQRNDIAVVVVGDGIGGLYLVGVENNISVLAIIV